MEIDLLNLVFILLAVWVLGLASNRLGHAPMLGALVGGIVLGPSLLGLIGPGDAVDALAQLGMLLMMLYIGMEVHPRELRRASRGGYLAAVGGFVVPFFLCHALAVAFGIDDVAAAIVGLAAGMTALAARSRTMIDLKLLDTRIAHVTFAGTLITNVIGLALFVAFSGAAQAGEFGTRSAFLLILRVLLFLTAAYVVGLRLGSLLGGATRPIESFQRTAGFTFVLLTVLAFSLLAELGGMHGIVGAFVAGIFLREQSFEPLVSRDVFHLVRDATFGLFAPLFFVVAGFSVELRVLSGDWPFLISLVALASIGKIGGVALFYRGAGFRWREGFTVGSGMNGRGAAEIIIAYAALSLGLIEEILFSALAFLAIVTSAGVPGLLRWSVGRLHERGELIKASADRSGVLIVGAGPTARALGRTLARSQPVWLVDRNREQCTYAQADGLTTVHGSALSGDVLSEACAASCRYLIALTPNSEVNALVAQKARSDFYVPTICVVHAGDADGHEALVDHLQIHTAFAGQVSVPEWDYRIEHERTERMGLTLERLLTPDELFRQLQRHRKSLPLAVRRGDEYIPFYSGLTLLQGDRVVMLQFSDVRVESFDRFDRMAADCPVLDLERGMSMAEFLKMSATWLAPRVNVDASELASRLTSRESASSTVLIPGLAIPHALIDGAGRFEMLIARCRNGIRVPGQPERVHALFVMVGTADERTFHLRAISAVAQLVHQANFEKEWMMAADAEALRKLVLHGPRRRIPTTA